jgi:hypothetical protein
MPTTQAKPFPSHESWRECVERHLRKFETLLASEVPDGLEPEQWKPFPILIAEYRGLDRPWHASRDIDQVKSLSYPHNAKGVYLYIDNCARDDPMHSMPEDQGRFSVIRYIGVTERAFGARPPKVPKPHRRMDWRMRAIVPFDGQIAFLALALEAYLLRKIGTTDNERPSGLGPGQIFTEYNPPRAVPHPS